VIAGAHLRFTAETAGGIAEALVPFVAVSAPPHVDGSPDLTALRSVTADLARTIAPETIVAIKSTIASPRRIEDERDIPGAQRLGHRDRQQP
jgi:UDP-glucose 6-dehydrogenase